MDHTKRSKLRWFAAEFFVVVTGVLVALAVQALYERTKANGRERDYLHQLRIDLDLTMAEMRAGDDYIVDSDSATIRLVRAFRTDAPPEDSVVNWLRNAIAISLARPILGTAEALISSGDLRLIQSDSLRSMLPAYVMTARRREHRLDRLEQDWQTARTDLEKIVDLNEVISRATVPRTASTTSSRFSTSTPIPTSVTRTPFPLDIDALLRDRRVYVALDQMSRAKFTHAVFRRRIAASADSLRNLISRAEPRS